MSKTKPDGGKSVYKYHHIVFSNYLRTQWQIWCQTWSRTLTKDINAGDSGPEIASQGVGRVKATTWLRKENIECGCECRGGVAPQDDRLLLHLGNNEHRACDGICTPTAVAGDVTRLTLPCCTAALLPCCPASQRSEHYAWTVWKSWSPETKINRTTNCSLLKSNPTHVMRHLHQGSPTRPRSRHKDHESPAGLFYK